MIQNDVSCDHLIKITLKMTDLTTLISTFIFNFLINRLTSKRFEPLENFTLNDESGETKTFNHNSQNGALRKIFDLMSIS